MACILPVGFDFVDLVENRPTAQLTSLSADGPSGERSSPKVQPSTRPGIEPGTSFVGS